MAHQSSSVPKLCPRCGAFYQDLSSQTCPQCFAKLEKLSDGDAAELIAQQERRSKDPEYIQARQAEDEEFKEQSFGACLKVVFVGFVTLIACIVIVLVGAQTYRHNVKEFHNKPIQSLTSPQALNAPFDQITPGKLAGLCRQSVDSNLVLPGTPSHVVHAMYNGDVQVYAVSTDALTEDQIDSLKLAVSFAANQHTPPLVESDATTPSYFYCVLAQKRYMAREVSSHLRPSGQ